MHIDIKFQLENFRFQDGSRGHLEGLASVYCEILMAPFGEVLMALESARQRSWLERSPKHRAGMQKGHRGNSNQNGALPNSYSQPLYVPGKYLVRQLENLFHNILYDVRKIRSKKNAEHKQNIMQSIYVIYFVF